MQRNQSEGQLCVWSKTHGFEALLLTIRPSPIKSSSYRAWKTSAAAGCHNGWDTNIDKSNKVRLYYNTITALGPSKNGNGTKPAKFEDNHFSLVYDQTSTEGAKKILTLSPELTGSSFTFKLYFSTERAIELFIGERFS